MSSDIVARFADGRLLVQESQTAQSNYTSGGLWVRVANVQTVERVLSINNDYEQYGLKTDLGDVAISGDKVKVMMRRGDLSQVISGASFLSGYQVPGYMSGIAVSGNPYLGEIYSGVISGRVTVTLNVIAR
ncbi:MAG: hypothetical protein PHQ43_01255 [Dehalococcoidales bacterium]|nr:hypothetical protein [Dehalococcoidales bacterium]